MTRIYRTGFENIQARGLIGLLAQGAVAVIVGAAWTTAVAQGKLAALKITGGTTVISAELVNNATSLDFLSQLPMTVRMTRSGNREYHGRPDKPVSVDAPGKPILKMATWAIGRRVATWPFSWTRPSNLKSRTSLS